MSLSFGKRDVSRMAEVLDGEYETAEEAASAVLAEAMRLIESKAKWTVVGQIKGGEDKIALGWFGTESPATAQALALTYNTQTHEEFRAWVLPVFHGTPNAYYTTRKEAIKAKEIDDRPYRERELARRRAWFVQHPGETPPESWGIRIAYVSETTLCPACEGVGRIRNTIND